MLTWSLYKAAHLALQKPSKHSQQAYPFEHVQQALLAAQSTVLDPRGDSIADNDVSETTHPTLKCCLCMYSWQIVLHSLLQQHSTCKATLNCNVPIMLDS